jgi:hypothetical protein
MRITQDSGWNGKPLCPVTGWCMEILWPVYMNMYIYVCIDFYIYVFVCIYVVICTYKCTSIYCYIQIWNLCIPKNAYIYYIYIGDSESRIYEEIPDPDRLKSVIEDYLNDYNGKHILLNIQKTTCVFVLMYISMYVCIYLY